MPRRHDEHCDQAMTAKWRFPNGGLGRIECDLAARGTARLPKPNMRFCEVIHKDISKLGASLHAEGSGHSPEKSVTIWNQNCPFLWHRIDIVERHTARYGRSRIRRLSRLGPTGETRRWTQETGRGRAELETAIIIHVQNPCGRICEPSQVQRRIRMMDLWRRLYQTDGDDRFRLQERRIAA